MRKVIVLVTFCVFAKGNLLEIKCDLNKAESCQRTDDERAQESDKMVTEQIKQLLKNYNRKLRPHYIGKPVMVLVDATIISFSNLDAIDMMYTIDMFFRQRWWDHRLAHNLSEPITIAIGTSHPSNIIWTPDTVFMNSVTSALHHVIVENHKVDIYPNGTVFWGTRITVSPSCTLDLKAYPMDVQICGFEIVSYTYDSRHLKYDWYWKPGIEIKEESMLEFKLTDHKTIGEERYFVAGNYTVLEGRFRFKRLMGFAITQVYLPSTVIVTVSWVSLWIKRTVIPARVSLCITTVLTISTIWGNVNAQLPRVSYVKAIDVYLMTSFICIILTLLEYTIVLNIPDIMKKVRNNPLFRKRKMVKDTSNNIQLLPRAVNNEESLKEAEKKKEQKIQQENIDICNRIEFLSRLFFPLAYTIFNIFYWSIYLKEDLKTLE